MTLNHRCTLQLGLLQGAETGPQGMQPHQNNIPRTLQKHSTASLASDLSRHTAALIVLHAPSSIESTPKTTTGCPSMVLARRAEKRPNLRCLRFCAAGSQPQPSTDGAGTEIFTLLRDKSSVIGGKRADPGPQR